MDRPSTTQFRGLWDTHQLITAGLIVAHCRLMGNPRLDHQPARERLIRDPQPSHELIMTRSKLVAHDQGARSAMGALYGSWQAHQPAMRLISQP